MVVAGPGHDVELVEELVLAPAAEGPALAAARYRRLSQVRRRGMGVGGKALSDLDLKGWKALFQNKAAPVVGKRRYLTSGGGSGGEVVPGPYDGWDIDTLAIKCLLDVVDAQEDAINSLRSRVEMLEKMAME